MVVNMNKNDVRIIEFVHNNKMIGRFAPFSKRMQRTVVKANKFAFSPAADQRAVR